MPRVYYSLMLKIAAFLLLAGLVFSAYSQTAQQPAKSSRLQYTDSHEGMTIGVDPWTTPNRYKEKFPKKSPLTGGVVALQVNFRNENEKGVRVDLQRMRLIVQVDEDNRQELEPLSPDDVADTVLLKQSAKDPTLHRSPLPIPTVGKPKTSARDAKWTEFRDTCQNAAVPSSVIAAHGSVEGLVYFDLRGEMELLQTAHLYVPNLLMMDSKEPISFFEIDLAHGGAAANP
jgi:hypothetical protein